MAVLLHHPNRGIAHDIQIAAHAAGALEDHGQWLIDARIVRTRRQAHPHVDVLQAAQRFVETAHLLEQRAPRHDRRATARNIAIACRRGARATGPASRAQPRCSGARRRDLRPAPRWSRNRPRGGCASAATCRASFPGSHQSSASRKATNSPRGFADPGIARAGEAAVGLAHHPDGVAIAASTAAVSSVLPSSTTRVRSRGSLRQHAVHCRRTHQAAL